MRIAAIEMFTLALIAMPGAAQRPGPTGVQSISYETGPCFGRCPVYRVTVSSNGTGRFEGLRFTTVEGVRGFRLSRSQFLAFAGHLAAYRPRGVEEINYGGPRCRRPVTDLPSVSVTWGSGRREDRLSFYYGCRDPRNAAMARALSTAPDLLPIRDFIGRR